MEFFAILTDSRRVKNPREPDEVIEKIEKYLSSKNIAKIYPEEDRYITKDNRAFTEV